MTVLTTDNPVALEPVVTVITAAVCLFRLSTLQGTRKHLLMCISRSNFSLHITRITRIIFNIVLIRFTLFCHFW